MDYTDAERMRLIEMFKEKVKVSNPSRPAVIAASIKGPGAKHIGGIQPLSEELAFHRNIKVDEDDVELNLIGLGNIYKKVPGVQKLLSLLKEKAGAGVIKVPFNNNVAPPPPPPPPSIVNIAPRVAINNAAPPPSLVNMPANIAPKVAINNAAPASIANIAPRMANGVPKAASGVRASLANVSSTLQTHIAKLNISGQWKAWLQGGWISTLKTGAIALFTSFVWGFIDELLAKVFRGKYQWIGDWLRFALKSVIILVSIGFLIAAIVSVVMSGGAGLVPLAIGVMVSIILGFVGFFLGKSLVDFLYWILEKKLGFKLHVGEDLEEIRPNPGGFDPIPNSPINSPFDPSERSSDSLVGHSTIVSSVDSKDASGRSVEKHKCGEAKSGNLYVGKCVICYDRTAVIGFVHVPQSGSIDTQAHVCLCNECSADFDLQNKVSKCLGCSKEVLTISEEGESIFAYFHIEGAVSECQRCLFVGFCPLCDRTRDHFVGRYVANRFSVEILCCDTHLQALRKADAVVYGKLYGSGID